MGGGGDAAEDVIVDRCILAMLNESAIALSEGWNPLRSSSGSKRAFGTAMVGRERK